MGHSESNTLPPISRRRFLKAGLGGAAALALYSGEIERHRIEIVQREISLRGLPASFDGFRIAQLSDIHLDAYTEPFFLRRAIKEINGLRPDVVFLTGDYVSHGVGTHKYVIGAAWQCANILQELECKQIYAVLGNHDVIAGPREIAEALKSNNIAVLNNSYLPIERNDGRFWLAGVDDPVEGHPHPELAIPDAIRNLANEPVILLCHAPDYADHLLATPVGRSIDLMLSGHTHGGQVRLPLLGAMQLPPLGLKYVEGWFQLQNLQLYVNRGLGTTGLPFRFDCLPEITLFTLRRDFNSHSIL
ncbi:MAG: metallophosphoesterase [Terracidiphilus sp.]|jgi:predicted MPP superfamily phosphohydrolase